eukprot:TRINITY_DN2113_c0_g1_i1.p1 TRINITY_DN2113_c0_g1~~TRINITY_DN2113_c0_g1_i1.p1  ORF type:complete len:381 (+),score=68.37 TRINITY_DN2113_c0_g1_i1:87-1229(+)
MDCLPLFFIFIYFTIKLMTEPISTASFPHDSAPPFPCAFSSVFDVSPLASVRTPLAHPQAIPFTAIPFTNVSAFNPFFTQIPTQMGQLRQTNLHNLVNTNPMISLNQLQLSQLNSLKQSNSVMTTNMETCSANALPAFPSHASELGTTTTMTTMNSDLGIKNWIQQDKERCIFCNFPEFEKSFSMLNFLRPPLLMGSSSSQRNIPNTNIVHSNENFPEMETAQTTSEFSTERRGKNPMFRTKPCAFFFGTGLCLKADHCNFSHDPAIFAKESSTQESGNDLATNSQHESFNSQSSSVPCSSARPLMSLFHTKPCKFFFSPSGICHKGNGCNFSHVMSTTNNLMNVTESEKSEPDDAHPQFDLHSSRLNWKGMHRTSPQKN